VTAPPPERLRLSSQARLAQLHGEAVVLHLESGRYFAANATGAALLAHLVAPLGATVAGLVDALVVAHGIEPARARADVDAWLARLRHAGLLEVVAAGPVA
jgi:hypothetical protein